MLNTATPIVLRTRRIDYAQDYKTNIIHELAYIRPRAYAEMRYHQEQRVPKNTIIKKRVTAFFPIMDIWGLCAHHRWVCVRQHINGGLVHGRQEMRMSIMGIKKRGCFPRTALIPGQKIPGIYTRYNTVPSICPSKKE